MAEYGLAIALDVVIVPNAMANPRQDGDQQGLADFERLAAEMARAAPISINDSHWVAPSGAKNSRTSAAPGLDLGLPSSALHRQSVAPREDKESPGFSTGASRRTLMHSSHAISKHKTTQILVQKNEGCPKNAKAAASKVLACPAV
jgi:hypothetical protein